MSVGWGSFVVRFLKYSDFRYLPKKRKQTRKKNSQNLHHLRCKQAEGVGKMKKKKKNERRILEKQIILRFDGKSRSRSWPYE